MLLCKGLLNSFNAIIGGSLCLKLGLETEFGKSGTGQIYRRALQTYWD